MRSYKIRTLEEYTKHQNSLTERDRFRISSASEKARESVSKGEKISAFSYPANQVVDFIYSPSADGNVNFRETFRCPVTNLNARVRGFYHIFCHEAQVYGNSKIYMTEQKTAFYKFMSDEFMNVTGSEYIGHGLNPGELSPEGVRHEDFTRLSFGDESIDCLISLDCLEHIPDYLQAFKQSFRVLKNGGRLFWTVPFLRGRSEKLVRARVLANGKIEHIEKPEYHGDPINDKGCLCYYHFAWDMLDEVRQIGFSDVYSIFFSGSEFGYFGPEEIIFVAEK